MAEVLYPLEWKDVNDLVHPSLKLEYDDGGHERWEHMADEMKRKWGYILSDVSALDLSECQTWRSIFDCIAAHVGKEWEPEWDDILSY